MSQRIDTGYADTGGVEKSLPPCPHDSKEGNASRTDFQSEKQGDKLAGSLSKGIFIATPDVS